ncbi:MAG: EFR1 family ferrodoxin [Clostridia bacterium]
MIFYFSGTGNSKWLAQQLGLMTNDNVTDIAPLMQDGASACSIGSTDSVGLVFPIYAWAPPRIMMEFIRNLKVESGAYIYAVCTCGDDAGHAMSKLKNHLPLKAEWSVSMPNNYIPMYEVDDPMVVASKIAAAKAKLLKIAEKINSRAEAADVNTGSMAALKTAIVNPLFTIFATSTKPFTVDKSCTGCGLCKSGCPQNVIKLVNGKPVWVQKHCIVCMACINRCPVKAIQYGEGTRNRGRYYFKED